jgi:hypothetical protein
MIVVAEPVPESDHVALRLGQRVDDVAHRLFTASFRTPCADASFPSDDRVASDSTLSEASSGP